MAEVRGSNLIRSAAIGAGATQTEGYSALIILQSTGSGATFMGPSQQYWWLASVISGLGLIAILWLNWGRPALRASKMKHPFDAFLTLTPEAGHDTWTAEQHVPSNTEIELQLRLRTRLHYKLHELIFGFDGNVGEKPNISSVVNHFIAFGLNREQSPETSPNHYIDYRGHYHIRETLERTKPNVYAYGFRIRTHNAGRFPIHLNVVTECGEGWPSKPLLLVVEDILEGDSSSVISPSPSA